MQTERVNTSQLFTHDVVQTHGGRFRLMTASVRPCPYGRNGRVYAFRTEYLGPLEADQPCRVPANWRTPDNPWIIQGNDLATWTREIVKYV